MNKKLIYFSLLSLVSSCFVLGLILGLITNLFTGDPLSDGDKKFIGGSFLVIQVLCSLLLPIFLALLAKYWKLVFKPAALIYALALFLCLIGLLIRIFLVSDQFNWIDLLINVVMSGVLPVIIFLISLKLFGKIKK